MLHVFVFDFPMGVLVSPKQGFQYFVSIHKSQLELEFLHLPYLQVNKLTLMFCLLP